MVGLGGDWNLIEKTVSEIIGSKKVIVSQQEMAAEWQGLMCGPRFLGWGVQAVIWNLIEKAASEIVVSQKKAILSQHLSLSVLCNECMWVMAAEGQGLTCGPRIPGWWVQAVSWNLMKKPWAKLLWVEKAIVSHCSCVARALRWVHASDGGRGARS